MSDTVAEPRIGIAAPLERAWARTRALLFAPFELEQWLVLGFAAFLAGLADVGVAGSLGWTSRAPFAGISWRDFPLVFGISQGTLDALTVALLVPLVSFAVVLFLALLWIGSRAKFVFLEDVLLARAAIADPWRRYKRLGDSLFLWRVGFWVSSVLALGMLCAPLLLALPRLEQRSEAWLLLPLFAAGAALVVLSLILACVWLLLESFVVPIMRQHDVGAMAAWSRLLPLLGAHPLAFALYALVVVLGSLLLAALLALVVFASCCLLLPLVALPYVSSVTLLPASVTFRLLGVEFLAQFSPSFSPTERASSAEAPAASP